MNLKELQEKQAQIDAEKEATYLEQKYKNSYYKNVDSIRKNIQFFFWVTVIPPICYILYFILTSDSFI